ncbi:hypothetical protein TPCV302_06240 [Cutibacterium avidum]|nr:hypothetical protein TPCV302_06240 [Cutibacterium avidum]
MSPQPVLSPRLSIRLLAENLGDCLIRSPVVVLNLTDQTLHLTSSWSSTTLRVSPYVSHILAGSSLNADALKGQ